MERIAALGADYLATIGALARTEAEQDAARIGRALRARALGLAVLALGALWLNVAALLWLLTTPYAIEGALAIAAVGLVAGSVMSSSARRATRGLRLMQGTRRVLADELGGHAAQDRHASHDPAVGPAVDPMSAATGPVPAAPLLPDEARERLGRIREALRETVALQRDAGGDPLDASVAPRFEPRSRTMRTATWLWRAIPRVPAGTAVLSALGVVAVSIAMIPTVLLFVFAQKYFIDSLNLNVGIK